MVHNLISVNGSREHGFQNWAGKHSGIKRRFPWLVVWTSSHPLSVLPFREKGHPKFKHMPFLFDRALCPFFFFFPKLKKKNLIHLVREVFWVKFLLLRYGVWCKARGWSAGSVLMVLVRVLLGGSRLILPKSPSSALKVGNEVVISLVYCYCWERGR